MIKGIHHIGITVRDMDEALAFYQAAADLALADEALGEPLELATVTKPVTKQSNAQARTVLLSGHTAYLELTQLADPLPEAQTPMPVYGPGITHVCYQSPANNSAFEKFIQQGATMHSRGDRPVKLARPDITYVYLRDEADNMFEVEQWDDPPKPYPVWIAHVALVSPDIERLTNFYSTVLLGMDAAPEIRRINGIPNLDVVGNLDDIDLYGTWVPTPNILLEIWQYVNPPTPAAPIHGMMDRLGYTHICFEVDDLSQEVARLAAHGVPFLSEPTQTEHYEAAIGHDPDGNLFELRHYLDPRSSLSLAQLELE